MKLIYGEARINNRSSNQFRLLLSVSVERDTTENGDGGSSSFFQALPIEHLLSASGLPGNSSQCLKRVAFGFKEEF